MLQFFRDNIFIIDFKNIITELTKNPFAQTEFFFFFFSYTENRFRVADTGIFLCFQMVAIT